VPFHSWPIRIRSAATDAHMNISANPTVAHSQRTIYFSALDAGSIQKAMRCCFVLMLANIRLAPATMNTMKLILVSIAIDLY